jgi:hypothetical protein
MLALAAALVLAAADPPARLPPVDECLADAGFVQFRGDLRRTVAGRNERRLLAIVADDIHASLGGHVGKKDFIHLWGLGKGGGSRVWAELDEALRLGCTMRDGLATVPSMEDQIGDRDAFETRIALPGATLRDRPGAKGKALARLDWHVLTLRGPWDGGRWLHVRLDDGRTGYIYEPMARSPIDYRAWFRKRAGRWVMEGFLAGD